MVFKKNLINMTTNETIDPKKVTVSNFVEMVNNYNDLIEQNKQLSDALKSEQIANFELTQKVKQLESYKAASRGYKEKAA